MARITRKTKDAESPLETERDEGKRLSRLLVDHLGRMGAAEATLPVSVGTRKYEVTVRAVGR